MWDLLNRVPGGLDPLRERFEQHVKRCGLEAVQKIAGGTVNAEGKPETMVRAVLDWRRPTRCSGH